MVFSTGNPPFLFRESILHMLCEFFVGPEANPWEEIIEKIGSSPKIGMELAETCR